MQPDLTLNLSNQPSFQVTLLPSNQSFYVQPDEMILDAAIQQGIAIAYTCRSGTCRTCLYEVKAGNVLQEYAEYCLISEQEIAANRRLVCMSTCTTDTTLEKPQSPKAKSEEKATNEA